MRKPFEKIKLSHLHTLCNTLTDTEIRYVSNIKRKYLEGALAFEETLSFLEDLKIVKNNSEELFLSKDFLVPIDSINNFKKIFLPVLFSSTNDILDELQNFLVNFQTEAGNISFKASELEKIKFSDTRNLLLELEFITLGEDNTTYFVNPDYSDFFVQLFNRRKLSLKTLQKRQEENDAIGLSAEKGVIKYEIERLTSISLRPNEIQHISQENASAGYDISSFENYLDKNSKRIPRFIEVKAVSAIDYRFFWSKNEIETAKIFGDRYYLYLLPVNSTNSFEFDKLIQINNPFKNVYTNKLEWKKEEESVSFSRNNDG